MPTSDTSNLEGLHKISIFRRDNLACQKPELDIKTHITDLVDGTMLHIAGH